MPKITIIGWYGTETIGDRAILAGILRILSEISLTELRLGSLEPNFTKRTLMEDYSFYCKCSNNPKLSVKIFNSLNAGELRQNINHTDCILIGGGPLMDLHQMYMLEYAFMYAKRKGKRTAVIGCGWGPLNSQKYIKCTLNILRSSDLVIFRDNTSLVKAKSYFPEKNIPLLSIIDPAFISADYYKQLCIGNQRKNNIIAINLRDISSDQYGGNNFENIRLFIKIIRQIIELYNEPIHLIPMHTYFIGGDDRYILNRLALQLDNTDITVHNRPLNLEEIMKLYYDAKICVGMRFHSIVLQTVLNGNNYILDYTNPETGKIISMMKDLKLNDQYASRYISLHDTTDNFHISHNIERISIDRTMINAYVKIYTQKLQEILK